MYWSTIHVRPSTSTSTGTVLRVPHSYTSTGKFVLLVVLVNTSPSTVKQFELAKVLQAELEELELKHIKLTDKCYNLLKKIIDIKKESF